MTPTTTLVVGRYYIVHGPTGDVVAGPFTFAHFAAAAMRSHSPGHYVMQWSPGWSKVTGI